MTREGKGKRKRRGKEVEEFRWPCELGADRHEWARKRQNVHAEMRDFMVDDQEGST